MNSFKMLATASMLSTLIGCSHATLSREDCLRGDWYTLGIQDGLAGKTQGELNLHKQACAEYGISPDPKPYMEGREKGLVDYCKIENAVTTGLSGQLYQSVCPKEIDAAFRQQNLAAYNLYLTYMRNSYYNNYYNGFGAWGGYGGYGNFGGYWNNPGFGYYGGGRRGFRPFGSFGIGGRW
jgi:hypothetical protein